jgi:hypothetical protein
MKLTYDSIQIILIHLDLKNLNQWNKTCHHINNFLKLKYFWNNKFENDDLDPHIVYGYPKLENIKETILYPFHDIYRKSQFNMFKVYNYLKISTKQAHDTFKIYHIENKWEPKNIYIYGKLELMLLLLSSFTYNFFFKKVNSVNHLYFKLYYLDQTYCIEVYINKNYKVTFESSECLFVEILNRAYYYNMHYHNVDITDDMKLPFIINQIQNLNILSMRYGMLQMLK